MSFSPMVLDENHLFLIECFNIRRDPSALERASGLVARGIEWEKIWVVAEQERVAPLLYYLTRHCELLPAWLLARCHTAYIETALQNTLRYRELGQVLTALSAAGIPTAVLKGAALATAVYENIALRPMLDTDLLVRQSDVRRALAVMESAGYQREGVELAPDVELAFENEIYLWKRDRLDWHLELHWGLFNSPFYQHRMSEEMLWESAEPLSIDGAPACSLSPENLLLHLCGHLALHHLGAGLLWWNDVAEVTVRYGNRLDWQVMLARAASVDLILPLKQVIPVIATTWQAPVPADVLSRLDSLAPAAEEIRMFDLLTAGHRPPAQRLLADLQGMPSWNERFRFLWVNLFPSGAYMDGRYGISRPALRVFYYPYRWAIGFLGLVNKYGKNR